MTYSYFLKLILLIIYNNYLRSIFVDNEIYYSHTTSTNLYTTNAFYVCRT